MGTVVHGVTGAVCVLPPAICAGCGAAVAVFNKNHRPRIFLWRLTPVPQLFRKAPFLTGAAGAPNVRGGVDISDARSGELRMRIFLPQQFMTDVDALHGDFLTTDENGQRLFAITSLDRSPQNAALTVVQLASVPLAIGSVSLAAISAPLRNNVNDSRQRVSTGDKVSRRRPACNGNFGRDVH
ncbi:MAG TPA: hypothetical protein VGO27_11910 [Candidatus Acidoferrum sp.]|nr:hypothetical protein [Candidatus Acidoferrum sp.]